MSAPYCPCERLPENVSEFARAAVPAYRLKTALNKSAQRESIGKSGRPMDATIVNFTIYLTATFAAALVTGVAGFAFGLVAAAVWLHILTPIQTATLIIAFGLVVQGISVWKLRHALRWSRLWPFLIGAAFG